MWMLRDQSSQKKGDVNGIVAVAIDRNRGSQQALKWTIHHLLQQGQTVHLIHVSTKPQASGDELESQAKELLAPFHCICTSKDIQCKDIILENTDIPKTLIGYVSNNAIEHLVMGAPRIGLLRRFKNGDIPSTIMKGAPKFCNTYIISKGKISSMHSASHPAPSRMASHSQTSTSSQSKTSSIVSDHQPSQIEDEQTSMELSGISWNSSEDSIRQPLWRMSMYRKFPQEIFQRDDSIYSVSSESQIMDYHQYTSSSYDNLQNDSSVRLSDTSDMDYILSFDPSLRSSEANSQHCFSFSTVSHEMPSSSNSFIMDDAESEMQKLKLELKQTMEKYNIACQEALLAKQRAVKLERWKAEEEKRLMDLQAAREAALLLAQKEMAKSKAALEEAGIARRIANLESQKRRNAEMKALKDAQEKQKIMSSIGQPNVQYRKYSIKEIEAATDFFSQSRKIGEGGYGPVYKGYLDHTPVAIKILRPDAAQGRSQFQQEVEILSCIRHPNMVLLLGACPEYGCLIYEFMNRGNLEEHLFRKEGVPPLSWQLRFKIAAEIGIALLFLHQTKPEPIVHRDLKPANILLDRNFVSKISDVGLARLVPPKIADTVTQFRMTSTAGTFCYIDPEYQQTGMLGVKSDVYSLGIMFLQIITAKPAMGITHIVEQAIENGNFEDALDPDIHDWPVEEALCFAKLALKCSELRRRDRPDLGKVVLPELKRLRALAEESIHHTLISVPTSAQRSSHRQVTLNLESHDRVSSPPGLFDSHPTEYHFDS